MTTPKKKRQAERPWFMCRSCHAKGHAHRWASVLVEREIDAHAYMTVRKFPCGQCGKNRHLIECHETVWQVEIDPYCRAVLQKHWPDAERFEDVKTVGSHNLSPVDVICGGFPCQDISFAGKGAGNTSEKSWKLQT